QCVTSLVHHQCRNANRWQDASNVGLHTQVEDLACHGGTRTGTLKASPPLLEALVTNLTRCKQRQHHAGAPVVLDHIEEISAPFITQWRERYPEQDQRAHTFGVRGCAERAEAGVV